jgi:DNA-binding winged helix-turn-helix (wHTH) protein
VAVKAWRFGGFCLEPGNRRLWRDAGAIELRPRTFAVLQFLVENAERLITQQELLGAVWGAVAASDSKRGEALTRLKAVYDELGEGFETAELRQARALLEEG